MTDRAAAMREAAARYECCDGTCDVSADGVRCPRRTDSEPCPCACHEIRALPLPPLPEREELARMLCNAYHAERIDARTLVVGPTWDECSLAEQGCWRAVADRVRGV